MPESSLGLWGSGARGRLEEGGEGLAVVWTRDDRTGLHAWERGEGGAAVTGQPGPHGAPHTVGLTPVNSCLTLGFCPRSPTAFTLPTAAAWAHSSTNR